MKVEFLGAVDTVTGSSTVVEAEGTRVLVDCGMFQGLKHLRERNWEDRGAGRLDAVVLTHAHLDHSGWLPRLVKGGYRGPIICTPATAALLRVLLLDAAYLQEEDARRANRRGYTRHRPALPLYTTADAERALDLVEPLTWDQPREVGAIEVVLRRAGHILGASSVRLKHQGRTALFSGDLGRPDDLLMHPPRPFEGANLLVVESTYGDRLHPESDSASQLEAVVNRVCGRGGILMVPAFAVGRSQALLHLLATLRAQGRIPHVPTFLNSPMAINASEIFFQHPEAHRLGPEECRAMSGVARFVRSVEESKAINASKGPMILIAGSGMISGGRILHHIVAFGSDPNNGILLAGYQAAGTRGAALVAGADSLRIHGEDRSIQAERFRIDAMSGHADWREITGWLKGRPQPDTVLINHGEASAADTMRKHLRDELGWRSAVARDRRIYEV